MSKSQFTALMVLAGVVSFTLLVAASRSNDLKWLLAALLPFILSPVALFVIRITLEYGKPDGMFNLSTQSWAFMIGDSVALPLWAFGGIRAWMTKKYEFASFFLSPWWIVLCVIIGMAAAYVWHFHLDGPGYIQNGYGELLGSPSKLWHDFPVYGALSGGLVYLGVPSIFQSFTTWGWMCLLGLLIWGALGLADNTVHRLDARDLHPPASQTALR